MSQAPHHHSLRTGLLLGAVALLYAQGALAFNLPKGVSQGPAMEGITEYRLPNGLKVLLFPDASKPTITVNMTYLVGSRHENYGETGMAHLLEHLLFKGATGYTDIPKQFSARGMRFNGSTTNDRTNYFESFDASEDNLKWSIGMEAARMTHSFVARKDLDSEMTVVRNEYEMGENNPGNVMFKEMQSVAFDWHANGHSTIGNRSDIENVRIENLQGFYRTYYQPDNAVLLVAGKFDPAKTLTWITSAFASVPKPTRSLPVFWTVEPAQDGERSLTVRRKGDYQMVGVGYKVPSALHADAAALSVLAGILGDQPNGRLHHQLVTTGKAVQAFAFTFAGYAPGLEVLGAVVKKGEPYEPVRDALIAAAEQFAKQPPTLEEVQRIQRDHSNYQEKMLADPEKVGVQMSGAIALGDWRMLFYQRDQINQVTPEQVAAVAARYLKTTNRVVANFLPDDSAERVTVAAAPNAAVVLANYTSKSTVQAGEEFVTSPENLDKRTQLTQAGGLKLALLPKKTRGATVAVHLNLRWGDAKSLFGRREAGRMVNAMLDRGTTRYTREQLADEMSKLKMQGNLRGFVTTRDNLAAALRLVAHVFQHPSFPANEFEQLKKQLIVDIEAGRNDPKAVAARAKELYFNHYPKGDPRAAASLDDELAAYQALTLADVQAYYRDFYGASTGELAIVGDFDPAEAVAVTKEAFGQWQSRSPYTRLTSENFDVAPLTRSMNTPDKENASYSARLNLDLRSDDPDYPALMAASYIFGSGGIKSRLMDRIRQKDGLSYGGYANIYAPDQDRAGGLVIEAIAAPQNLAKLDAAIREELARAVKAGFTAEEVENAKKGLLQHMVQGRAQDDRVAGAWASKLFLGRTFAWDRALEDKLAKLTPEQVSAAMRKAVDPSRLVVFMAGDEAKAKAGVSAAAKPAQGAGGAAP